MPAPATNVASSVPRGDTSTRVAKPSTVVSSMRACACYCAGMSWGFPATASMPPPRSSRRAPASAGEHGQPGRYRTRFGIASGNRDAILLVRLHGRGDAELAQLGHTEGLNSERSVPLSVTGRVPKSSVQPS